MPSSDPGRTRAPRVPIRYGARPCSLVVCRGCCCGDPRKTPGTDHAGQLDRLRAAAAASGGRLSVRTSDCLGVCERANVVVVQPSTEGRRRGGRAAWIGYTLDDDCLYDILAWTEAGGPGLAPLPDALALQLIDPPKN